MQARTLSSVSLAALAAMAALSFASCRKGFGSGFEGTITMHIHSSVNENDIIVKTKNDKMRFEMGGNYMVFDPATNVVTMVNDDTKSYTTIDFASPTAPQPNTSADTAAIEKSGKHETIAGIDCEDWTAKDPSGKRSEVCIAQGIAFFDVGSLKGGRSSGGLAKELREKKLFPLRDIEYDATGKELSRMDVTKVDKQSLPDTQFTVPKDYAKR